MFCWEREKKKVQKEKSKKKLHFQIEKKSNSRASAKIKKKKRVNRDQENPSKLNYRSFLSGLLLTILDDQQQKNLWKKKNMFYSFEVIMKKKSNYKPWKNNKAV